MSHVSIGLPTLDLSIPGLPPLPSPPSLSLPLPPSLSPGAPSLNPARGSVERCKLSQLGLGRSPSRQTIWCISEPKGAALVATVFVNFFHISMPGGQFAHFRDKVSLARDTGHRGSIPGRSRPFRDGWQAYVSMVLFVNML